MKKITRRHAVDDPYPSIEDMNIAELEHLRGIIGISAARLCAVAGIHPRTYKRWQRFLSGAEGGSCPGAASLKAVREALAAAPSRASARQAHKSGCPPFSN
jgi:hypothetical protein